MGRVFCRVSFGEMIASPTFTPATTDSADRRVVEPVPLLLSRSYVSSVVRMSESQTDKSVEKWRE